MKELAGNIWDYCDQGFWIVVTTNGTVKRNGECVMGRGLALQAKKKFPNLALELGRKITFTGNKLYIFPELKIITLPVKHNWWERADLGLIDKSVMDLGMLGITLKGCTIYMTKPGCFNGKRDWETEVKPILDKYLDEKFIVVDLPNA